MNKISDKKLSVHETTTLKTLKILMKESFVLLCVKIFGSSNPVDMGIND